MSEVINIFKSLGADETIFQQFVIFFIVFAILKPLLFDKILEVLKLREDKTVNLQDLSGQKFTKAENMAKEYSTKISDAQNNIFEEIKTKKIKITQTENDKIHKFRNDLEKSMDEKRQEFKVLLDNKRKDVLSESEGLSDELVEKLV
ncbi:MAG: hypothetical protein HOJ35_11045 [Bdellovibrionales bacterium]|jgi:F0F1-type ATP synthase membrane subunit b/b'|nr:hypothetical protein [Bdellovibrionales bacterium]